MACNARYPSAKSLSSKHLFLISAYWSTWRVEELLTEFWRSQLSKQLNDRILSWMLKQGAVAITMCSYDPQNYGVLVPRLHYLLAYWYLIYSWTSCCDSASPIYIITCCSIMDVVPLLDWCHVLKMWQPFVTTRCVSGFTFTAYHLIQHELAFQF
jgi:hypothetical protein